MYLTGVVSAKKGTIGAWTFGLKRSWQCRALDLDIATAAASKARPPVPSDEQQPRAFRAFDVGAGKALCPDVVPAPQMVADTLSVCCELGLLALLSMCAGLVPKDRFEPAPSISMNSTMWVCLIQPGSANSSGVIRVVTLAVEKMFKRLWV